MMAIHFYDDKPPVYLISALLEVSIVVERDVIG